MRSIINWLEHRTGIESAVKGFLYEDIPASSGWHQVFGSMALFAFLVQIFTGILLALNYAPTPGDAYSSVQYIMHQLTAGYVIRGIHYWGATMMIVIVVMHMIQVFIHGAYKKPREATWILGVILLLLTLAFGLTGYLLPWDNKAYWGTVVTTQIMGSAPGMGPYIQRLAGAANGVGVITFARFFAIHVLVLPPLLMLLIGVHVYLVRKHGVAPEAGDTAPHKKFFPEQVFKDTVAIFIAFVILLTLAIVARAPLEKLADPTTTTYTPRPAWYFLFLFETLKFMQGPLEIVGTMVLPGLAVLALFLVPFIDRGPAVRLGKRAFAIGLVVLGVLGWSGLTAAAWVTTPANTDTGETVAQGTPTTWQQLTPEALSGVGLFLTQGCTDCHAGPGVSPDLTRIQPEHLTTAWLIAHFKNPAKMVPGSAMPPVQLPDAQLNELAAFIQKLTPDDYANLTMAPAFALKGAKLYQDNHCDSCHMVNGAGAMVGPPLNGVSKRHDKAWLEKHFNDPQSTTPGSAMPAFKFNPQDMDNITNYLLALPQ